MKATYELVMGNILTRRQSYNLDSAVSVNLPETCPSPIAKSENPIKEEIKRDLEEFDASVRKASDTSLVQSPEESEENAEPEKFFDPRSPSSCVNRTPLVENPSKEKDSSETPLRDSRDNLCRKALQKDQKAKKPVELHFELPEEVSESEENDENIDPEGSPIPKSPKKEHQSSDLSILADKMEDLALQTPIALKK